MLNRLLSLTGLALIISITVPAVHQARSGHSPAAVVTEPAAVITEPAAVVTEPVAVVTEPEPLNELPAPIAQAAPVVESNQAILTDTHVASSALAAAPQSEDIRLEIHLGRREVLVYQGDRAINRYPIGVGRSGWETPTGTFQVQQMRENPTWISPFNGQRIPGGDARNPLGTRWIGFWTDGNNWIGFHGTRNPQTVGRNTSHGCIHMHTADLENLYRQVALGTSVTVRQ